VTRKLLGTLMVMAVTVAACGGSSPAPDSAAPNEQAVTETTAAVTETTAQVEPDDEEDPPQAEADEYAIVTVGSDTYEFRDADVCSVSADSFLVSFQDGDDELVMSDSVVGIVLVVVVDGDQWGNPATQVQPDLSEDRLTWADILASSTAGRAEPSSIEVQC